MGKFRLLIAVFAGTLFYTLISVAGGRDGIWASNQLQEQKQALSTYTARIEKTNGELSLEKIALEKDLDVIAAYAKKLGYVSEGEKLVKLSGLAAREVHIFDPGTVMRHQEVSYIPEWICKFVSFLVFFLVYVMLLLLDIQSGNIQLPVFKRQIKNVGGIQVYDMQQIG
ncbi:MAG: septum formation initiator family protein [Treponema sp.]|nr:septum formation initiator family protein [Spirochaetia bacterium]MDD7459396.1 septum formation initiator family protein [Spirochaetales bacterium]MDY5810354.1 septum formation initiator family protein [Treponema sp.]MEE1181000.1 septum formation initiator family protein [Treponema sp.]